MKTVCREERLHLRPARNSPFDGRDRNAAVYCIILRLKIRGPEAGAETVPASTNGRPKRAGNDQTGAGLRGDRVAPPVTVP